MNFTQPAPNFANFPIGQTQGVNPAPFPQIPYKPITFEKLSNLIGITYNLSAIENINTIPLPRGSGEQQLFFVNNDEKIYARSFDNSIGIVGYKEDYVEKLKNDLKEAQDQLQEIFNEIIGQPSEKEEVQNNFEERLSRLESSIAELMGGNKNESERDIVNVERISEVAEGVGNRQF